MKNLKILALVLAVFLVLPLAVFADEATEEVNVYLFRGEGCPHCAEAEEWFKSIEDEYGNLFNVVDYETWYDQDNAELMQRVAEARGEEAKGVPYIIIGNKSWNGFAEDYEDEMLSEIQEVSKQSVSDRYDIMNLLPSLEKEKDKPKSSSDVLALIIILLVAGGLGFGIYKARKAN